MSVQARRTDAGLTLVEVLVTLAIFAVIGTAGFGMLDQILRARDRGEERLDRLAEMQRALFLFDLDLGQARRRSLVLEGEGAARAITFRRDAPMPEAGTISLRYGWQGSVMTRSVGLPGVGGSGEGGQVQVLLPDVAAIGWRFHDRDRGWLADWPPPERVPALGGPAENPQAVELVLTLGDGRALRRIAILPDEAR